MTVSQTYMNNRKVWQRPQAMIWASDAPTLTEDGRLIPVGYEVLSFTETPPEQNFLILSDHNRQPIDISNERIEQRQRMANGTMRSFFIADKTRISTSWNMLPSRSFNVNPEFGQTIATPNIVGAIDIDPGEGEDIKTVTPYGSAYYVDQQYTADGGAGGAEMLKWYETHKGPFWVMLSYDKYTNFGTENDAWEKLSQYSDAIQMYIADFNYSVVKRGGNNFDMWNISVTLEEV